MSATDRDAITQTVIACLADVLEVDASSISVRQSFKELEADSLHLVEFSYEIERIYREQVGEFTVNDEDLASLTSVSDAIDYVYNALHA
jgi:acyl carrier protein